MKTLILIVCICVSYLGVAHTVHAQKQIAKSSPTPTNSRQQDGLHGQVRRVRVETVALLVKDGKTVEGPRVVRGIATYDARGQKIDSVDYPADESTVVGNKQQYVHDTKGNIVETIMLGDDGSILSKAKHDYEFDEFGNWKKMTASIAVYENGKVSYEPFEITNRIITYYYGQPPPKSITAATVPPISKTNITASARPAEVAKPASDAPVNASATGTSTSGVPTNITAEAPVIGPEKSAASITVPAAVTTKDNNLPTIRMSEDALRKAAIDLPQPQYPEAARLLGAEGIVEVQILIDEKGEVTKASALSGDVLFTELAAEAARKAKFSRVKLSPEPAKIYGVINYTFNLPDLQPAASPAAKATSSPQNASESNQGISDLKILQPGDAFETDPEPAVESLTPAASFYEKGLGFLASGHNSEAVEALKQATNLDPNNAAAYAKLGIAYAATRQYREAIVVLKMALRIKPEMVDAEAYYRLSNSYSALKKFGDALQAIKQA
ncbi:MAG TPA: TonB family protein, partial [Pyrinomonadaceae bacterium]|nr:TonB family protein [Pyrinomonadaceae bacterium]